jgi:glycosyltransferase involved in cell wall biosynthesis
MITYNHEKYIEEAINGVLMQETDFEVELIISNDNSLDQTDAIIQRILKEHPKGHWISYIKHEKNIGMMENLVDNFKRCHGEYIACCEGDHYWTDKHKLQIQINLMRENPQCYLSFHPANEIINNKLSGKVWANHLAKNKVFTDIEMIRNTNLFCPTASMILCRKALDPFPDFLTTAPLGDNFLQILGSLNGGALFIAKNMSIYRRGHPDSWTTIRKEEAKRLVILDNDSIFIFY